MGYMDGDTIKSIGFLHYNVTKCEADRTVQVEQILHNQVMTSGQRSTIIVLVIIVVLSFLAAGGIWLACTIQIVRARGHKVSWQIKEVNENKPHHMKHPSHDVSQV